MQAWDGLHVTAGKCQEARSGWSGVPLVQNEVKILDLLLFCD